MYQAALPSEVDQGAIVRFDLFKTYYSSQIAYVITPRCDIAQGKADFLLLAAIATPSQLLGRQTKYDTTSKRGNFLLDVLRLQAERFHWLSEYQSVEVLVGGAIVDFQLVTSVTPDRIVSEDIVAMVSGPYCEQIGARYAAYVGRVGVPDLMTDADRKAKRSSLAKMFDQQQAGAKLATEPATDGPDPQFHTGPDEQAQFD